MGGHEAVKAAVVAHLATGLPAWVARVQDSGLPADVKHVAASDILPDKDTLWPCVLVASTAMARKHSIEAASDEPVIVGVYDVTVTVAHKHTDPDAAALGRDRLLLAARSLFLADPGLGDFTAAHLSGLQEVTNAVAVDLKTRPVAMGSLSFQVAHAEVLPVIDPTEVESAAVTVNPVDATGSI